ncbi:MAG: glycogen debranching enzyme family protein [Ardenticatenaceae bacterium]|nr:glycogen debranching enzyme family protein [Anaerolineales bacterium]MCB8938488.1 glycogen debranching enzyme family protein [Ardenticatenaceae bacterium]MCB8973621.1 glycogen debranching enzyme family protein [Ardenticatenaceae bacterium]
MLIDFGRELCGDLATAESREWLVTNGIGGFASGTVAGVLTRRYHGLLMAALQPPLGRTLLLAKLDETVEYEGIYPQSGRFYPLYVNRWANGVVEGNGHRTINQFHLEGTTPVWTHAFGNALLEKRIWMQPGANTTYIQYKLTRATGPLTLEAKAFVNYRDYHETIIMNDWEPEIDDVKNGLSLKIHEKATPFYLLSSKMRMTPQFDWYEDFYLSIEEYRGQNDVQEDHIYAALLRTVLRPGDSVTLVASTDPDANLDGDKAYAHRQAYEAELLDQARKVHAVALPPEVAQLVLAADQFVVKRPTARDVNGRSVIAGYPWFSDWGRDTMIALPGLTLTTGRPEVAASILRTYAQFVDQGMLPNRFPDAGEHPEYNTVDATLWYFEAIRAYHAATQDNSLVQELFPTLQEIILWHKRGTRYNIQMDENDGLLFAGEEGVQLTWMDAKVDNWVVTSRIGKPVEINALWYNALCIMAKFARLLDKDAAEYDAMIQQVKQGFGRFWNKQMGYCYDVIDGPDADGLDGSLRPNQLIAISLPHSPLPKEQQRSALDACGRHLLTAHGLRSLSPDDKSYIGHYGGDRNKRDGAYHQGTVWGWLIGPFVSAHLRVYGDKAAARSYLDSLLKHHIRAHAMGSLSEIFDGDPPFTPRGCVAQAWTIAEVLRTWQETIGEETGD